MELKEKLIKTFDSCKKEFEHFHRLYKKYGGNDHLCASMDYYGRAHMIKLILETDMNCYDCSRAFTEMKKMENELY